MEGAEVSYSSVLEWNPGLGRGGGGSVPGSTSWGQFQTVPDRRGEQRNSVIRKAERGSQCGRSYYFLAKWRESGG